jgi:predicted ATP-dependent endonuclease of OLD family
MYLSDLVIINYRSCRNVHLTLDHDYPNVLIGINDCGKSTILQAIGLLLNPKAKFNFVSEDKKKSDISNTPISEQELNDFLNELNLSTFQYKQRQCLILGRLVIETSDINENNQNDLSNHLRWAISKSDNSSLWIAKQFDEETQTSTLYMLTPDTEEPKSVYNLKATQLNKMKTDLNISKDEIENINQAGRFTNIELIEAIYTRFDLLNQWVKYDFDKKFWLEYRYLDWSVTLEQLTQFANDVVNQKINNEIQTATTFAKEQATLAQTIVNTELGLLVNSLREDLQNITAIQANISFQVSSNITDLLIQKENSDGAVHLESQGDGVKRQLWFALIKWSAMKSIAEGDTQTKFIWCFDEPETHLYPKAQREFFEIIKSVSIKNVQSVISTHSTVFIDRVKLKNINKFDLNNGYSEFSKCSTVDDIYQSLQIKNSDFLFYDKFLIIEGDTEQVLIPHLYELKYEKTLLADNIQVINLGGKDKRVENRRILESIINGFRKETSGKIIYFLDKDAIADFTPTELERMQTTAFFGRQDLEDAIASDVWRNIILTLTDARLDISVEEINLIKDEIPLATAENNLNHNQKFYYRLRYFVDRKAEEAGLEVKQILPTKGSESGKLLCNHITNINQVEGMEASLNLLNSA